ncbi:MAG TPA: hypothetical protein VE967_19590 [Gemmatimonadaceae bacterium]|nr:hypothetical protein [Gemmatimonadaceae bacterium]
MSETEERILDLLDEVRMDLGRIANHLPNPEERRARLRAQIAAMLFTTEAYDAAGAAHAVKGADLLLTELGL